MRTIQLIIASLADSILEAKSSGKDPEKHENTTTKIEESEKSTPEIQEVPSNKKEVQQ